MLRTLTEFVEELRAVGIPVSMVETLDAAAALRHTELGDREAMRAALGATLIKDVEHVPAFEVAFDVFFGLMAREDAIADGNGVDPAAPGAPGGEQASGGGSGDGDAEALFEAILTALEAGDEAALQALVRQAVGRLSGMEPGRPVGGRYYFYRVMRRLDGDRLAQALRVAVQASEDGDRLDDRLAASAAEEMMDRLHTELRREIVRRLVADRGAQAVARTLRTPLIEDLDLMHATRDELQRIERTIAPLARKLATRLAQRRRHGRKGRLDVRRTIRRSLGHGGVLLDPQFKPPRKSKPELVLLCDVSGSMATFARFTMQLTFAVGSQFSRVRSFAFIDGLDEVTDFFGPGAEFHEAMATMNREAKLVWRDGHSDYGNALEQFQTHYADAVTPRATVIITGDARNNYRQARTGILHEIAASARSLYWLNPEAKRYWDTGDSIMSEYRPLCDGVYEVRTIRQLEEFIERVALRSAPPVRRHLVSVEG